MPGDDGATPLHESMKQDYGHINKHANCILYFRTTTCQNNTAADFYLCVYFSLYSTNSNIGTHAHKALNVATGIKVNF